MMVFVRSRFLLACAVASAALLLVSLVLILANVGSLEPPLVLHMGSNGADFFGAVGDLYGLWTLGLVMVVVNTLLGARLYRSARPLTCLFFSANVFLAVLLIIAIGTVVSVN